MNKQGNFLPLIVMVVLVFTIVLFSVIMIYAVNLTTDKLHETLDNNAAIQDILGNNGNATEIIDNTFGKLETSYAHLHWITVMLIFALVLGILFGSYKVRTEPIYFVPYLFGVALVVVICAGLANAYETIIQNQILAETFAGFTGANHFMLYLPLYMGIIGVIGGIIMFISWVTRPAMEAQYSYYGY